MKTTKTEFLPILFLVALVVAVFVLVYVGKQSQLSDSDGHSVVKTDAADSFGNWTVSDETDPISDKFSVYATSNNVAATRQLRNPYGDVKAWLGVGCSIKGDIWAYIGFSSLNSRDGELRAKWDDKVYTHRVSVSDTDGVHFLSPAEIINLMKSSSKVVIGIDWFQEREAFFEWELTGANEAIPETFMRCNMEIERLVAAGKYIYAVDEDGRTALHSAALGENAEVVKELLVKGLDVNAVDKNGNTPLHLAALGENTEVVKELLVKGLDVNAVDKNGNTPLHSAAEYGHAEVAKVLIAAGANVNATGIFGYTALEYVRLLRDKGYLTTVKKERHDEVIRVLKEAGAR